MKDYLNEINEKHPIRRTKEQKEQFFNYLKASLITRFFLLTFLKKCVIM